MKRIYRALGRLASLANQDRYIVHGTADEYELPEDIFDENVNYISYFIENHDKEDVSLSSPEKAILKELLADLKSRAKLIPFGDPSVSSYQLVYENEHWVALREKAMECLRVMKVSIEEIEKDLFD